MSRILCKHGVSATVTAPIFVMNGADFVQLIDILIGFVLGGWTKVVGNSLALEARQVVAGRQWYRVH